MKKFLFFLVFSIFFSFSCNAENIIKLPEAKKDGGMPIMEALSKRKSNRNFSGKEFDKQIISNILWSAFGVTREDGRRTIPTAKNEQNLSLYAILPNGLYLYDAVKNELNLIVAGDYRSKSGMQKELLAKSAMIVVYVEKSGDRYNKFNTGAATQNVGLYCASEGLGSFVIGSFDVKQLLEISNLSKDYNIQVIQAIGYLK